ncbi:MAG TPA: YggT family protein [Gemmatimonadales bacterium]|nr:YggT family protein [Gemmatimonadales bacterium]
MIEAYTLARYVVFVAFAGSALVALASWLVRTRRVSPFGFPGRTLRAVSDPLIRPVETRLVRLGGNPTHAGWWLVVGVAAIGVAVLAAWNWVAGVLYGVIAAFAGGPRAMAAALIVLAYRIVVAALVVRVLASWFGYHRYTRWLRPAYVLTDWVVEPIRRVLPPFGALDWSPLAAWLALVVLEKILLLGVGS